MRYLHDREHEVIDLYLELLNHPEVEGQEQAARYALSVLPRRWLQRDFVRWLTRGSLNLVGHDLVRVHLPYQERWKWEERR